MYLIKKYFNNSICLESDSIDPYNLLSNHKVSIVGSFPLQKFTHANWVPNDIDYIAHDKKSYDFVFKFFDNLSETKKITKGGTVHFYMNDNSLVQLLPAGIPGHYKDIRFRIFYHDISICQIGHTGSQYVMSKLCYDHIQKNIFCLDENGIKINDDVTKQRIEKYIQR